MEYLKRLRLLKDVSQQDVANFLGISRQAYSNYENGNRGPDTETLLKLAEYFEVTVDEILRGKEKAPTAGESSERDEMTGEILEELLKLPPKSQEEARKYIRFLAQQASEENP